MLTADSWAQLVPYTYLGTNDGLIQSQVNCIEQDVQGRILVGTMVGITRFNGNNTESFSKKHGLAEGWVTAMHRDKFNNIWVGHWGGSVSKYVSSDDYFKEVDIKNENKSVINSIQSDTAGNIYFATQGSGILILSPNSSNPKILNSQSGLLSNNILSLKITSPYNFIYASHAGVGMVEASVSKNEYKFYHLKANGETGEINDVAYFGSELVCTAAQGLFKVLNITDQNYDWISIDGDKQNYTSLLVNKNQIYVCSPGNGFINYSFEKNKLVAKKQFDFEHGLSSNETNCLYKDNEDNLWIGTNIGLNLYRGDGFLQIEKSSGMPHNMIWDIKLAGANTIWAATEEGLTRLDENLKAAEIIRRGESVQHLATDGNLKLWYSIKNQLYEYNQKSKSDKLISLDLPPGSKILAIEANSDGVVYIGTDAGLYQYNSRNGATESFTTENGLSSNTIYRITANEKGNVWFACLGGKIHKKENDVITTFSNNDVDKNFILGMDEFDGTLFVGSYNSGLLCFNGKEWSQLTVYENEIDYFPVSILAEKDYIWIGTYRGLGRYNRENGEFFHLSSTIGFRGIECNPGAIVKRKDGSMLYGTIYGVTYFDSKYLDKLKIAPSVFINQLRIFFKEESMENGESYFYKQNHLTFSFTAVSQTFPNKLRYQYKLVGFDESWNESNKNSVTYTNINPGNYTFLVRASLDGVHWSEKEAAYAFTINPPFWRRWWFIVTMFICVAGVFVFIVRSKARESSLQRIDLESKIMELNEDIKEKNRSINKTKKEYEINLHVLQPIENILLGHWQMLQSSGNMHLIEINESFENKHLLVVRYEKDMKYIVAIEFTSEVHNTYAYKLIFAKAINDAAGDMRLQDLYSIYDNLLESVKVLLKDSGIEDPKTMISGITILKRDKTNKMLTIWGKNSRVYLQHSEGRMDERFIGPENSKEFTISSENYPIFFIASNSLIEQRGGAEGVIFGTTRAKTLLHDYVRNNESLTYIENQLSDWKSTAPFFEDMFVLTIDCRA